MNGDDFADVHAIRVSNLDSVAQRKRWNLIVRGHGDLDGGEGETAEVLGETLEFYSSTDPEILTQVEGDVGAVSPWGRDALCERLLESQKGLYCDFAGVLRTAFLYRPVLCLTHAELVDGTFFMAIGPERVRTLMGLSYRDAPALIIRGPGEDLLESLLAFFTDLPVGALRDPDSPRHARISGVEPSVLRVGWLQRRARLIEPAVVDLDCAHTEIPARLASALEVSYGLRRGDLHQLGERWAEWIAAVQTGQVLYQRNTRRLAPDAITAALSGSFVQESIPPWARLTEDTWHRLTTTLRRTDAWTICENLVAGDFVQAPDEAHPMEVRSSYVKAVYSFGYQMALADQHEAAWITVQDSTNEFVHDMLHRTHGSGGGDAPMALAGEATRSLGAMPATVFAHTRYAARDAIAAWQQEGSGRREARAVAYAIRMAQEQKDRRADLHRLFRGGALTVVLAVLSVLLDNSSFPGSSGLYLVPLLSFVLTVLPDLPTFVSEWWAMRGDSTTLIVPQ